MGIDDFLIQLVKYCTLWIPFQDEKSTELIFRIANDRRRKWSMKASINDAPDIVLWWEFLLELTVSNTINDYVIQHNIFLIKWFHTQV